MVTFAVCPKTREAEHTRNWSARRPTGGDPADAFLRQLQIVAKAAAAIGVAEKTAGESVSPKGLSLEETLWVLRNTPHPIQERPPELLEAFERFWQRVDAEPPGPDEDTEAMRDASSQHDNYIYGQG